MIYMFDVDGTLTEPRQKMSQEFQKFFTNWMEGKIVYLVTGSDIQKLKEQVPQTILDKCDPGGNDYELVKELDIIAGNDYYKNVANHTELSTFLINLENICTNT